MENCTKNGVCVLFVCVSSEIFAFVDNFQIVNKNILRLLNIDAECLVMDESFAFAWTFVIYASGILTAIDETKVDVVEINVIDFVLCVSANETTVFGCCGDVVEVDAAHFSTTSFGLALRESPVGILVVSAGTWV